MLTVETACVALNSRNEEVQIVTCHTYNWEKSDLPLLMTESKRQMLGLPSFSGYDSEHGVMTVFPRLG